MISIYPANKSNYYYIKSISTKVFYFYICVMLRNKQKHLGGISHDQVFLELFYFIQ